MDLFASLINFFLYEKEIKKKNLFGNKVIIYLFNKFNKVIFYFNISMSRPQTIEPNQGLTMFHRYNTVVFVSCSSEKGITLKIDSPRTKEAISLLGLEPNFYEMKLFL